VVCTQKKFESILRERNKRHKREITELKLKLRQLNEARQQSQMSLAKRGLKILDKFGVTEEKAKKLPIRPDGDKPWLAYRGLGDNMIRALLKKWGRDYNHETVDWWMGINK